MFENYIQTCMFQSGPQRWKSRKMVNTNAPTTIIPENTYSDAILNITMRRPSSWVYQSRWKKGKVTVNTGSPD